MSVLDFTPRLMFDDSEDNVELNEETKSCESCEKCNAEGEEKVEEEAKEE